MSAPAALASSRLPVRARDAHHVAEAGEDHAVLVGQRDPVVDPPHRDHAHRTARAVHELDVGRQQVVDAVLVDRVGVPAAHLHDLVVAPRFAPATGSRRPATRPSSASRNSSTYFMRGAPRRAGRSPFRRGRADVAGRDRIDQRGLDAWLVRPSSSAHSASPRSRRRAPRVIGLAVVTAGDAVVIRRSIAGAGSRRSLDHARLQLLELLLVVGAHPLEQVAGRPGLLLVHLGDREADVDQDPVARARRPRRPRPAARC